MSDEKSTFWLYILCFVCPPLALIVVACIVLYAAWLGLTEWLRRF